MKTIEVRSDFSSNRTAREWLEMYKWNLVEPTREEISDLEKVMEQDEFWEWASDKVDYGLSPEPTHAKVILTVLLLCFGWPVLALLVAYGVSLFANP